MEDILWFGSIYVLNATPKKQFDTNFKATYLHTSKQRYDAYERDFFWSGKMVTNAPWKTSRRKNKFSSIISN